MKKNYEIPNVNVHRFDVADALTSDISIPEVEDMVNEDVVVW